MILLRGYPAAWNYTYGPAYFYKGPRSLDEIYQMGEPVVVVADMIPMDELRKMELTRVRGFVLEEGSPADEDHYNFFMNEKRAAVMGVAGARRAIEPGEWIIVDGVEGVVCVRPDPDVLEKFNKVREQGPPRRSAVAGAAMILRHTMEAFLAKREAERAAPEAAGAEAGRVPARAHAHAHDHDHERPRAGGAGLMQQLESKVASQPGLVSVLLDGIPIPRSAEPAISSRIPIEPAAAERAKARGEAAAAAGAGEPS